jgi:hypothetical protein
MFDEKTIRSHSAGETDIVKYSLAIFFFEDPRIVTSILTSWVSNYQIDFFC